MAGHDGHELVAVEAEQPDIGARGDGRGARNVSQQGDLSEEVSLRQIRRVMVSLRHFEAS